jgi:EAL domain-containing protein (putative c-di-GMP-specific phosphodiesterase class I)
VGAASLQYLHGFQVDFVKLDGSLVKKLGTSPREDTMLKGVVRLCNELGIETIAECIENADLRTRAIDVGFDYGQGHHLGKPAPAVAATKSPSKFRRLGKREGVQVSWG